MQTNKVIAGLSLLLNFLKNSEEVVGKIQNFSVKKFAKVSQKNHENKKKHYIISDSNEQKLFALEITQRK